MTATLNSAIKKNKAEVFRRASIKRRNLITGLFEDDWLEISDQVKSFGKITSQLDATRFYKFTFGNLKLVMFNDDGQFNPEDSESSLWYGFLNQQRTLVKIEAGFINRENVNGIWYNTEFPSGSIWDNAIWDASASTWDTSITSVAFVGVISGDILLGDNNQVTFNVKPLVSVFQDYPAKNLTGWTSTGMTASQFIGMVRDQQDSSGNYIFRPFFENTTTFWDISTTSNVYGNLNTSTATEVFDKTVWEVIEKLAESENFVPYISRNGVFKFVSREANTSVTAYEFHGVGSFDSEYGQTIKSVRSYGRKPSKYYSRVQVKWRDESTSTAYEIVEASLTVSGDSNPWILGHRTLQIENFLIPTSTVANTIAQTVYNEVSQLKREIDFTTSFVPGLDILDRFSIYYDPSEVTPNSLWDQYDWAADNTSTSTDLVFDNSRGDAINLTGQEFKFLTFELDLDNLENRFVAREV